VSMFALGFVMVFASGLAFGMGAAWRWPAAALRRAGWARMWLPAWPHLLRSAQELIPATAQHSM